ncbi:MAG: PrsW family glutamic-type intramembrane protease [Verrucomicrobia bacterium]|nr:PrsW family glutamic-type intramembrane protease [Verrucomicrobiota bacterium]
MKQLKAQLYNKSRSRSFLWKLSVGTVLLGIVFGFLSSFFDFKSDTTLQSRIGSYISSNSSEFTQVDSLQSQMTKVVLNLVRESLESGELETEELLIEIPHLQYWIHSEQHPQFEALIRKHLPEADVKILLLFINALSDKPEPAKTKLEQLATSTPTPRYANQILGIIASDAQLYNKAYPYFLKESEFPEAQWAREQAVLNRFYINDFEALEKLANDPLFSNAFKPRIRAELAIHKRDWLNAIKWIALGQLARIETGIFILATIGMVVWSTILLQLGQATRFDKLTPFLCLGALFLGVLSTTLTLFWIILEDLYLPISGGDDLFHNIVYYVATVGLREEVCKLLFFLPLAPVLIKRGNEMEFLLVASFAGLGFAYQENFSYLSDSMGTAFTARFLTANFLHISLTGMSGLFFCRAWRTRGYSYNDFLYIFGIAVIAHGLYDALLTSPLMEDGGLLAMILYILFSKFYFKEAHNLRQKSHSVISLTGTMAFGVSLLIASLLVYLSIILNLPQAIQLAFSSFLGSAIILFMFFREFNESLVD